MLNRVCLWCIINIGLLTIPSLLMADENLAGVACRSVHLQYKGGEGTAFYNEVEVKESAQGTYFCVCGFNKGYYGIQELANGKKLLIFSVWDPGKQNDPKEVPEEQRVKLVFQGEGVRIGRFGNEGTGGQSFFDFDWQAGQTYRFLVTAVAKGERTEFSGYFWLPEAKAWKHLVTFSTLAKGQALGGYYSFVEDFRRNKISATQARSALFGNGWVRLTSGEWTSLSHARFTADNNPALNINAAAQGDRFLLETGGDTQNKGTKLNESMQRLPAGIPAWPEDVK